MSEKQNALVSYRRYCKYVKLFIKKYLFLKKVTTLELNSYTPFLNNFINSCEDHKYKSKIVLILRQFSTCVERAYTGRLEYRDKFIKSGDQDYGHEYQIEKLGYIKCGLNNYLKTIKNTIKSEKKSNTNKNSSYDFNILEVYDVDSSLLSSESSKEEYFDDSDLSDEGKDDSTEIDFEKYNAELQNEVLKETMITLSLFNWIDTIFSFQYVYFMKKNPPKYKEDPILYERRIMVMMSELYLPKLTKLLGRNKVFNYILILKLYNYIHISNDEDLERIRKINHNTQHNNDVLIKIEKCVRENSTFGKMSNLLSIVSPPPKFSGDDLKNWIPWISKADYTLEIKHLTTIHYEFFNSRKRPKTVKDEHFKLINEIFDPYISDILWWAKNFPLNPKYRNIYTMMHLFNYTNLDYIHRMIELNFENLESSDEKFHDHFKSCIISRNIYYDNASLFYSKNPNLLNQHFESIYSTIPKSIYSEHKNDKQSDDCIDAILKSRPETPSNLECDPEFPVFKKINRKKKRKR